jgi:hypothetical protein
MNKIRQLYVEQTGAQDIYQFDARGGKMYTDKYVNWLEESLDSQMKYAEAVTSEIHTLKRIFSVK